MNIKESHSHKIVEDNLENTVWPAKSPNVDRYGSHNDSHKKKHFAAILNSSVSTIKNKASNITNSEKSAAIVKRFVGDNNNASSVSSVFNKSHEHITIIKRVFKKSMMFLGLTGLSFLILIFLSVNPFLFSPVITILIATTYVAFISIFYIILGDRSYLFIACLLHFILFLLINSFIGQVFSVVTILSVILFLFLLYLAYIELEKIQLGSRLFAILQITNESSKILWSAVFLVLSVGLFNHISHVGTIEAFNKYIVDNPVVWNGVVMGESTSVPLHKFSGASEGLLNEQGELLFSGFLAANYIDGKPVVSAGEQDKIILECENTLGINNCGDAVLEESQSRLTRYKNEFYNDLGFELETPLDEDRLEQVLKQYYKNSWGEFVISKETKTKGDLTGILKYIPQDLLISRDDILPASLALAMFIILMIFRWLFMIISSGFLWGIWHLLLLFKFVKIEVEVVEAEVVSI